MLAHCLQSRVKEMDNKGEDAGKMGVTSKEKTFFFKKRNFFRTKG